MNFQSVSAGFVYNKNTVPMPFMYIKFIMTLLCAFKFCGSFQLTTTLVSLTWGGGELLKLEICQSKVTGRKMCLKF